MKAYMLFDSDGRQMLDTPIRAADHTGAALSLQMNTHGDYPDGCKLLEVCEHLRPVHGTACHECCQ